MQDKKTAPQEREAAVSTAKALRRMLDADFRLKSVGMEITLPDQTAAGRSNFLAAHMTAHIAVLQKCLEAVSPVPAYDRKGIQMHTRLQRLSHAAHSVRNPFARTRVCSVLPGRTWS